MVCLVLQLTCKSRCSSGYNWGYTAPEAGPFPLGTMRPVLVAGQRPHLTARSSAGVATGGSDPTSAPRAAPRIRVACVPLTTARQVLTAAVRSVRPSRQKKHPEKASPWTDPKAPDNTMKTLGEAQERHIRRQIGKIRRTVVMQLLLSAGYLRNCR